ncbi:MAG: type II/IV secretion system ATPase subunit [Candidatus Woesearchaeota archaeon]|jgi:flagellar protein FlaI
MAEDALESKKGKKRKQDLVYTSNLDDAKRNFVHVEKYLRKWEIESPGGLSVPEFVMMNEVKASDSPNIIYPVGDPIFIHVYKISQTMMMYHVIEPEMDNKMSDLYEVVLTKLIEIAHTLPVPDRLVDIKDVLLKLLDEVVEVEGETQSGNFVSEMFSSKIKLDRITYEFIKYFLIRNRLGYGVLEPLLRDSNLEDIHCTGVGAVHTVHKKFGPVETSIIFKDDINVNKYMIDAAERAERPISEAHPVVDAIMPDGSRVNFIYGREVSLEGSSFTIRKFSDVPVSITQIINWGTMSSEMCAYLWLCLEHGMNLFMCGETASGKTTSLNAMCVFIKPNSKIYSVENTPEVTMPHDTWQHLVTREQGKTSDVTYFDLLIAALRSRPNYIIVGEIRGEEGRIAFQAMQTGHPVLSTFHAGSVRSMIQRLTGPPINVPAPSIDNLNIVVIQQAVDINGRSSRRVTSLTELERYYDVTKKIITRQVFLWDPRKDRHVFRGLLNSYILEEKIAKMLGMSDKRDIYTELDLRRRILDRMVQEEIFNYFDVWEVIKRFHEGGVGALPFTI